MKILVNDSKSDDELISIFMGVVSHMRSKGIKFLSKKTFDRLCRAMHGKSIGSAIRDRFANPPGSGNGFTLLKTKFGLRGQSRYTREELIENLYQLYVKYGRQPLYSEVGLSGISNHVYESRFGKLSDALKLMYRERGITQDVIIPPNVKGKRRDRVGEDISRFDLGIREAPTNEMGVVALFSKIHDRIGFPVIVKIQQDFPDCIAECTRDGQRFRARIEFKYQSSYCYKNKMREGVKGKSLFLLKEVDYLICWEKDSDRIERDTSVEIISLKDELIKLRYVVNELKTTFLTA